MLATSKHGISNDSARPPPLSPLSPPRSISPIDSPSSMTRRPTQRRYARRRNSSTPRGTQEASRPSSSHPTAGWGTTVGIRGIVVFVVVVVVVIVFTAFFPVFLIFFCFVSFFMLFETEARRVREKRCEI